MGIVERSWEVQEDIEERVRKFGKGKYGRVLKMARKPDEEEFHRTSKIVGAGIIIIGAIGFAIFYLMNVILGGAST